MEFTFRDVLVTSILFFFGLFALHLVIYVIVSTATTAFFGHHPLYRNYNKSKTTANGFERVE